MKKIDMIKRLNELEVVDFDANADGVLYVNVEDNEGNRQHLMELGATKKDIKDMASDGMLDISNFAYEKCGADWYKSSKGFGKESVLKTKMILILCYLVCLFFLAVMMAGNGYVYLPE